MDLKRIIGNCHFSVYLVLLTGLSYTSSRALTTCPVCTRGMGLPKHCDDFSADDVPKCFDCPLGRYNDGEKDGYDRGGQCKHCTNCTALNRKTKYKCRPKINSECGECLKSYYDPDDGLEGPVYAANTMHCNSCQGKEHFVQQCNSTSKTSNNINGTQIKEEVTSPIKDKSRTRCTWCSTHVTLIIGIVSVVVFLLAVFVIYILYKTCKSPGGPIEDKDIHTSEDERSLEILVGKHRETQPEKPSQSTDTIRLTEDYKVEDSPECKVCVDDVKLSMRENSPDETFRKGNIRRYPGETESSSGYASWGMQPTENITDSGRGMPSAGIIQSAQSVNHDDCNEPQNEQWAKENQRPVKNRPYQPTRTMVEDEERNSSDQGKGQNVKVIFHLDLHNVLSTVKGAGSSGSLERVNKEEKLTSKIISNPTNDAGEQQVDDMHIPLLQEEIGTFPMLDETKHDFHINTFRHDDLREEGHHPFQDTERTQ